MIFYMKSYILLFPLYLFFSLYYFMNTIYNCPFIITLNKLVSEERRTNKEKIVRGKNENQRKQMEKKIMTFVTIFFFYFPYLFTQNFHTYLLCFIWRQKSMDSMLKCCIEFRFIKHTSNKYK